MRLSVRKGISQFVAVKQGERNGMALVAARRRVGIGWCVPERIP